MKFSVNAWMPYSRWIFIPALLFLAIGQVAAMPLGGEDTMTVRPHRSFFRLPVSNGLIAATFNIKKQAVDGLWPHIYKMTDKTHVVPNLVDQVSFQLQLGGKSLGLKDLGFVEASYLNGTGIIHLKYRWKDWHIGLSLFAPMAKMERALVAIVQVIPPQENETKSIAVTRFPQNIPGIQITETSEWVRDRLFQKMFIFSVGKEASDFLKSDIKTTPSQALLSEVDWWEGWQKFSIIPEKLSPQQRRLYLQSLVVLKMAQCRERGLANGQILASLPPGMWNIAWVRDGVYSIVALAKSGHFEEAKLGLKFMLQAQSGFYEHFLWKGRDYGVGAPYQISVCRYFGEGREESDFNENGPNIELDGFGLFLWALDEYVKASGDRSFLEKNWKLVVEKIANPLLKNIDSLGVIRAESGPWERHLPGAHFAYTTEAAIKGFKSFSYLAGMLKDDQNRQFFSRASANLKRNFLNVFVDSTRQMLMGRASGQFPKNLDASAIEAINWGIVNPTSELARKTLALYREKLHIKNRNYGFCRLLSSDWYDSQEWVFVDFRMAKALRNAGQGEKSRRILRWIEDQAAENFNLIAELFEAKTADYQGAVPMVGYGAGAYILNFLE